MAVMLLKSTNKTIMLKRAFRIRLGCISTWPLSLVDSVSHLISL